MREISLHILDLVQNSIRANAKTIKIKVVENTIKDLFVVTIKDDGHGMDKEFLKNVADPFKTSRTTRKVGLGISLFKQACELCDGDFIIESRLNKGTTVIAKMKHKHIDRMPLGDIASTLTSIISMNSEKRIKYYHSYNDKNFDLDTDEIKKVLGDVNLNEFEVINWLRKYINENEDELKIP